MPSEDLGLSSVAIRVTTDFCHPEVSAFWPKALNKRAPAAFNQRAAVPKVAIDKNDYSLRSKNYVRFATAYRLVFQEP